MRRNEASFLLGALTVWPFGPKLPCPQCGKNVGKPRRPEDFLCRHCGQPGPWASPEQVDGWKREQDEKRRLEEARQAARKKYAELMNKVVADGPSPELVIALKDTASLTGHTSSELQAEAMARFRLFVEQALQDNSLSEDEDERMLALVPAFGLSWEQIAKSDGDLSDRLIVASANAGRLPTAANTRLIAKPGETVHHEFAASLMKEVAVREWRAGSAGISIPLGHSRTRLRFGSVRGRSVVIGTEMQAADEGVLSITSQRAVFTGARKTVEMQYKKLASVDAFSDGIRIHVTNRQNASLFKVRNGEVVAAILSAAQREGAEP